MKTKLRQDVLASDLNAFERFTGSPVSWNSSKRDESFDVMVWRVDENWDTDKGVKYACCDRRRSWCKAWEEVPNAASGEPTKVVPMVFIYSGADFEGLIPIWVVDVEFMEADADYGTCEDVILEIL